jgi:hypothetical protein
MSKIAALSWTACTAVKSTRSVHCEKKMQTEWFARYLYPTDSTTWPHYPITKLALKGVMWWVQDKSQNSIYNTIL